MGWLGSRAPDKLACYQTENFSQTRMKSVTTVPFPPGPAAIVATNTLHINMAAMVMVMVMATMVVVMVVMVMFLMVHWS